MSDLQGKVALITGGGRGLGAAICHTLATDGAIAVVADIRTTLAEEVAAAIHTKGGKALALPLDVTDETQVASALAQVVQEFGRLDILINNAGIDVTLPVADLAIADWDRIMAVNLRAPFVLAKLALPYLQQQQGGQIINISSTAAKRTWANAAAYHASKWGLLGFSHALHVEARPQGIKVTAVIAGGMRTPFLLERFPDLDPACLQDPQNVAATILHILTQPAETVIPEVMVLPMTEQSWP